MALNATHDPARQSFVEAANAPDCDFPIQNLPYGVFGPNRHVGVAIGDQILDLTVLEASGILTLSPDPIFTSGMLNPFMALPPLQWSATRAAVADLLDASNPELRDNRALRTRALVPMDGTTLHLPIFVRSFTDFYAGKAHATNVGTMFRGADNALPPNWLHIPIGYNGRASTVVVSGTPVRRPLGQLKGPDDPAPHLGPSRKLDIELELGAIVGASSPMGHPISTADADAMLFGLVLLNDWSARDIQVWEYQPLGPFQSKAFATTVSPWVVSMEALEPFRTAPPARDKPLLPYLEESRPGTFDIDLSVSLTPHGGAPTLISRTNARELYYSPAQQLTHHAISGCAMETGDLLGSGTISGTEAGTAGSLLELSRNGRDPIKVDGGTRTFIEDGDTLSLSGAATGPYRVGFGPCIGTVLPAVDPATLS